MRSVPFADSDCSYAWWRLCLFGVRHHLPRGGCVLCMKILFPSRQQHQSGGVTERMLSDPLESVIYIVLWDGVWGVVGHRPLAVQAGHIRSA